jgi:hypothetical protein
MNRNIVLKTTIMTKLFNIVTIVLHMPWELRICRRLKHVVKRMTVNSMFQEKQKVIPNSPEKVAKRAVM